MKLSTELQNKVIDFLTSLPNIYDSDSQRVLLYQAGLDKQLQSQILIGRPPAQFVPLLVSTLISYGRLNDGRDALEAVLEASKDYVGTDKKHVCDRLIAEYHGYQENEKVRLRPLKVFLCHSSEDKPAVRELYAQLASENIDPWLDEEKLLPGQDWKLEIAKALRTSDAVLICLSKNSITKRGYIQKELKDALDIANEQPEGSIFAIPLKLEECDVPEQLRHLHWVNYFEETGHYKLIRALQFRASELELEFKTDLSFVDRRKKPNDNKDRRIKILFLGTNPTATVRLKLDEEVKRIQINLKLAKERENLVLAQEWAVTIETLMQAILDESPQIVHFSGHGTQEGLILQNEVGDPQLVTSEGLLSLFKLFRDTIECVVLNSCYSEPQAKAIKEQVPYVIGMKSGIPDKVAISFSTGFYKALGAGRDIPFAFELGITAIKLEGQSGENIPILLS